MTAGFNVIYCVGITQTPKNRLPRTRLRFLLFCDTIYRT